MRFLASMTLSLGLFISVSTLSAQTFILPRASSASEEKKAVRNHVKSQKKKPSRSKTKNQSPSPQGTVPVKVKESVRTQFDPQNFEWNPKNIQDVFPNKAVIRMQPQKSVFFETDVGMGFLTFAGLSANLYPSNYTLNSAVTILNDYSIQRGLSYNQVPLYEFTMGKRFTSWFNFGLSYIYQGGMAIQSKSQETTFLFSQFFSNLSINSFQGKFMFEMSPPIPMGALYVTPYLGLAGGVAWQSWTQTYLSLTEYSTSIPFAYNLYFKPTYVASATGMADLGLRTQIVSPYYPISFKLGCKFNYWGQVRNVGSMTKQGRPKIGLTQPFRVKALYQWTPYLSVQWNFTPVWKSQAPYTLKNRTFKSWTPFFYSTCHFAPPKNVWTQASAGLGTLHFKGVKGVIRGIDGQDTFTPFLLVKDPIFYNKTPLFEYQLGYRIFTSFRASLSYQYQSGVAIRTQAYPGVPPSQAPIVPNNTIYTTSQFRSDLTLNALALKFYLESPWSLIFKGVAFNPYLSFGMGASWQTWYNLQAVYNLYSINTAQIPDGATYPGMPKNVANFFPTLDFGLSLRSAYPNSPYSITAGCKFNYWGQARHIIYLNQSSSYQQIRNSFQIKHVYGWAPYLGFQWNFLPSNFYKASHQIRGKNIYRVAPFWTPIKYLENRIGPWTGLNMGLGLLFFDEVKGNFIFTRGSEINNSFNIAATVPLKGRLIYNPSPIYEYMLGFTLLPELQVGLSLQHQSGTRVQTKSLDLIIPGSNSLDTRAIFSSNLALDGLLLKTYFNSPWSMVMLGCAMNVYVGGGLGAGFQTWNQTQILYLVVDPAEVWDTYIYTFKQTFCANLVAMGDAGLVFQSAKPLSSFSFRLGCKFNYWGQARNIGALDKQGESKLGFFKPFSIRTVYQFAPYGGVQWTF